MENNATDTMDLRQIAGRFFLRNEENGVTVYDKPMHTYDFYEGLRAGDVPGESAEACEAFLAKQQDRKTKNIRSKYPFYIGWQLSGTCNLNCIYCFADNKIHNPNTDDIMDTANTILSFRPIAVGLSGGEPTMNPRLAEIMRLFHGRTNGVLNTNGTTDQLEKLIPVIKETNTFVRLTIDAADNDLLNELRPPIRMPKGGFDQIGRFRRHIGLMQEAGVSFMIHTVVTAKNLPAMEQTAQALIDMGVTRWHLYSVDYSEKCKDIFDDIKVTTDRMRENHENLTAKFGDKLKITSALLELGFRARAVLLVDSLGRFLVDTITDGLRYIGENPKKPTYEELMRELDYETHTKCYLRNFW